MTPFLASKCPKNLILADFNFGDTDRGFTGGLFIEQAGTVSENLRGYYQADQNGSPTILTDYCLWWHKPYRHWWIGHCRNRGDNNGLAYLNPDVLCPHEGKSGDWRRGGSDTELPGFARVAKKSDLNGTIVEAKEAVEKGA